MFLKILHASTVTLALGCDLFGTQCLAQNQEVIRLGSDEKAFASMVKEGKCSEAVDFIWHRVATGAVGPTELFEKYIEDGIIVFNNLKDYDLDKERIYLMLQMKIFGRSHHGSDTRLLRHLSSAAVTQPGGKKVGVCLVSSRGSGEAVQECIESAEALGIVDDFMKFYFYADKAMGNVAAVQCGRK